MKVSQIRMGDNFTIEGVYEGSKGQTIINGRNVKTGRKCTGIKLKVFIFDSKTASPSKIVADLIKYQC